MITPDTILVSFSFWAIIAWLLLVIQLGRIWSNTYKTQKAVWQLRTIEKLRAAKENLFLFDDKEAAKRAMETEIIESP